MAAHPEPCRPIWAVQRAITHDMTFEMAYVGVRGQWFEADGLANPDQLTEQRLNKFGLSLNNADDISLLEPYHLRSDRNRTRVHTPLFHVPVQQFIGSSTEAVSPVQRRWDTKSNDR